MLPVIKFMIKLRFKELKVVILRNILLSYIIKYMMCVFTKNYNKLTVKDTSQYNGINMIVSSFLLQKISLHSLSLVSTLKFTS